ncbi:MAG: hypothetical protein ACLFQB_08490 [Chitinispirillaceae bacterium]
MKFSAGIVLVLLFSFSYAAQPVKRGRNEGTFNIPATNVLGHGNITVGGGLEGGIGLKEYSASAKMHADIGVADILQLSAASSFPDLSGFGHISSSLQATIPGNDRLRFFGLSAKGELFLSMEGDTLSGAAVSGKPDYNSFVIPSLLIDLDFIALFNTLPLKLYTMISTADSPELLYRYDQISFKTGLEWKLYRHSYFVDMGYGIFREKRRNDFGGDENYAQKLIWVEPGGRMRIGKGVSLLGSFKLLVSSRLKSENGMEPTYFRASFAVQYPLVYKETKSEAVRSLVFIEQEKIKKKDEIAKTIEQRKTFQMDMGLFEEKEDTTGLSQEEILERREEIEAKMREIERLLQ